MKATEYHTNHIEQVTEKQKIIFQFVLMTIASIIAGFCFAHLLNAETLNNSLMANISCFFSDLASGTFSEIFSSYLMLGIIDCLWVCLGFIFTFSFINYIVSDIFLIFSGFKFGINSALIKLIGVHHIGVVNSLSYWILKGCYLVMLTWYLCKLAFYSADMKRFSSNGRTILNKNLTISCFLLMVSALGIVFIVNAIYFLIIYIF